MSEEDRLNEFTVEEFLRRDPCIEFDMRGVRKDTRKGGIVTRWNYIGVYKYIFSDE